MASSVGCIWRASLPEASATGRLPPGGRRWWRRRSRRIWDLLPGDRGEEAGHDGGEAVGLLHEGVVAGALEDLQAAVLEGGGDRRVVGPGRLWIVAAHTNQRRGADFPQAGSQVDPADAGLPAGRGGGSGRRSPGSTWTGGTRLRSTKDASR
jgi:hypothetical protein